ncbi:MAG: DUF4304 domain-containing protein [Clostridia bacterium]|nr:DUF4304 domain-containing protein [Clostridia bacterium]
MDTKTGREILMKALNASVISDITSKGFKGKWPHFRKQCNGYIELISFMTNKYGGSFTVEFSVAFPQSEDKNYTLYGKMTEETLNVWATNNRYRVPGMFDGWFYYTDVYCLKQIIPFRGIKRWYYNTRKGEPLPDEDKGWRLVQKFDNDTAVSICKEIDKQFEKGFKWMRRFERSHGF